MCSISTGVGQTPISHCVDFSRQLEHISHCPADVSIVCRHGCRTNNVITHNSLLVCIMTQYVTHKVRAHVPGLPDTSFTTEEQRPAGVMKTSWQWQDPAAADYS